MSPQRKTTVGRRKGGYSQAARVLLLLDYLRDVRVGISLLALAKQFEVTDRQIRRDLEVLEEAGHPLEWVAPETGPRLVKLRVNRQIVRLGIGDRFALLAVRRVFDVLKDTPIYDYIQSVQDRLALSLPAKDREELEAFGERFIYVPDGGVKPYKGKENVLDGLLDGVIRRRRVRFSYKNPAGKLTVGVFEPWAIALYRQGLYAIGHAPEINGKPTEPVTTPRVYAAERFDEVEPLDGETFTVPATFKLDHLLQGAFGLWVSGAETSHVIVDFDAKARPYIEARLWHPTQTLRKLPGGGVRLELDVADTTQVVPWVLSWGPLARLRAPDALVQRVRDDAAAIAPQYSET